MDLPPPPYAGLAFDPGPDEDNDPHADIHNDIHDLETRIDALEISRLSACREDIRFLLVDAIAHQNRDICRLLAEEHAAHADALRHLERVVRVQALELTRLQADLNEARLADHRLHLRGHRTRVAVAAEQQEDIRRLRAEVRELREQIAGLQRRSRDDEPQSPPPPPAPQDQAFIAATAAMLRTAREQLVGHQPRPVAGEPPPPPTARRADTTNDTMPRLAPRVPDTAAHHVPSTSTNPGPATTTSTASAAPTAPTAPTTATAPAAPTPPAVQGTPTAPANEGNFRDPAVRATVNVLRARHGLPALPSMPTNEPAQRASASAPPPRPNGDGAPSFRDRLREALEQTMGRQGLVVTAVREREAPRAEGEEDALSEAETLV